MILNKKPESVGEKRVSRSGDRKHTFFLPKSNLVHIVHKPICTSPPHDTMLKHNTVEYCIIRPVIVLTALC